MTPTYAWYNQTTVLTSPPPPDRRQCCEPGCCYSTDRLVDVDRRLYCWHHAQRFSRTYTPQEYEQECRRQQEESDRIAEIARNDVNAGYQRRATQYDIRRMREVYADTDSILETSATTGWSERTVARHTMDMRKAI